MPQQAKAALFQSDEEGVYRFSKGEYDIFFFPPTEEEPAKLMVKMIVKDVKVPATSSPAGEADAFGTFSGEEQRDHFVFLTSKVEMRLLEPRSANEDKEFRIEFEVPGAILTRNKKVLQSSGSPESK